jgi:hypothetical protein
MLALPTAELFGLVAPVHRKGFATRGRVIPTDSAAPASAPCPSQDKARPSGLAAQQLPWPLGEGCGTPFMRGQSRDTRPATAKPPQVPAYPKFYGSGGRPLGLIGCGCDSLTRPAAWGSLWAGCRIQSACLPPSPWRCPNMAKAGLIPHLRSPIHCPLRRLLRFALLVAHSSELPKPQRLSTVTGWSISPAPGRMSNIGRAVYARDPVSAPAPCPTHAIPRR